MVYEWDEIELEAMIHQGLCILIHNHQDCSSSLEQEGEQEGKLG